MLTQSDEHLWTDTAEFSNGGIVHLGIPRDVGKVAKGAITHACIFIDSTVVSKSYAAYFGAIFDAIVLA
jgi:hypothetical protein